MLVVLVAWVLWVLRRLDFEEFHGSEIPRYAILTHTWDGQEVTYQDWLTWKKTQNTAISQRQGFRKILGACEKALRDKLDWIWIDTNCIDKTSSAELSESINSMYAWYRDSWICYAYMSDVPRVNHDDPAPLRVFRKSKWFTRGWTLQELLAPQHLVFFSQEWSQIGQMKDGNILRTVSEVTGIQMSYLTTPDSAMLASTAQKMSWLAMRTTTRIEDIAYCMLGLFDINMPLLYGEGMKAFIRLQEEIIRTRNDHTIFCWTWNDTVPAYWASMLAPSPQVFQNADSFTQRTDLNNVAPYSITNLGLSINVPIIYSFSRFYLVLDAGHKNIRPLPPKMADTRAIYLSEEDWPDPDVDSGTEEGAEAIRRGDAAYAACMERMIEERRAERARQIPDYGIPKALYLKAQDEHDQLTDEERALLLSRGDIIGKALAYPDSVALEEMHEVLLWPSPSVVRANIQRATGGTLSTTQELYNKGKIALTRGLLVDMLSHEEVALIARSFHSLDDTEVTIINLANAMSQPGAAQAWTLMLRRMGLDFRVWHAALCQHTMHEHKDYRAEMQAEQFGSTAPTRLGPSQSPQVPDPTSAAPRALRPSDIMRAQRQLRDQLVLGNITEEEYTARQAQYQNTLDVCHADKHGIDDWPANVNRHSPMRLFGQEMNLMIFDAETGWFALNEDQRESYRARVEAMRREAWAWHHQSLPVQNRRPLDIVRSIYFVSEERRLGTITAEEAEARNLEYIDALRAFPPPHTMSAQDKTFVQDMMSWPPIPPPSSDDHLGTNHWPPIGNHCSALNLFATETGLRSIFLHPAWFALPEYRKDAYRARCEALRREAWAKHERELADGTSVFCKPIGEPRPRNELTGTRRYERAPRVQFNGIMMLREELVGMELDEIFARWDAMSNEEKQVYEARAVERNAM
ncbi:putative het domain-containing protein [Paramyrothecium foliicola]|nr:putative het domain-containing protein [Paramyrothecium foliicola]